MKKTTSILACMSLASTVLLAGCGGASDDSGSVETDTAAADATSEPDTTVTEDESEIALESPIKPAAADPIRGPGGLEAQCIARVSSMTGGKDTTTNHIEESEAAVEVYLNVEGVEEPWKCLGTKDGAIEEVMYTGSEGAA